jgi:hypothetical protein
MVQCIPVCSRTTLSQSCLDREYAVDLGYTTEADDTRTNCLTPAASAPFTTFRVPPALTRSKAAGYPLHAGGVGDVAVPELDLGIFDAGAGSIQHANSFAALSETLD